MSPDDSKTLVTVLLAGVQRETSAADAYYVRGRAIVTVVAGLFIAVQAAFVALLGRTTGTPPQLLLSHVEQERIGAAAGVAALGLLVAGLLLLFDLDRPRPGSSLGPETFDAYFEKSSDEPFMDWLPQTILAEQEALMGTNVKRRRAGIRVAVAAGVTLAAVLIQIATIYAYAIL